MPIIYLHVGPHKTGSTYLQVELENAARSLRSQCLLYPEAGTEFPAGHHNIANFFSGKGLNNTTHRDLFGKLLLLANNASGDQKILLSSENFMRLSADDLLIFRLFFKDFDFHVIYFQRKDLNLFFSLWNTMVSHGSGLSLDVVDVSVLTGSFNYNPFAHEENISKLKMGLGAEVTVMDYMDLRARHADILDEFANFLGIKIKATGKTVNSSRPIEHLELIRAANLYHHGLGFPQTTFPRESCLKILESRNGKELDNYLEEKIKVLSKVLSVEHFIHAGFPTSDVIYGDTSRVIRCIPGKLLFDELEKDNIPAWYALKKRMENTATQQNHLAGGDISRDRFAAFRSRRFFIKMAQIVKKIPILRKIRSFLKYNQ